MDNKKILIAYYSRTGTTKIAAESLAQRLGADLEEIIDKKDRAGALGYIFSGRDALRKLLTDIEPFKKDPSQYDLVVLGTPVWAATIAPAIRTYLVQQKDKIAKLAFFCTMSGSGNKNIFAYFEEAAGKKPLATLAMQTKEVRSGSVKEKIEKFMKEIESILS